MKKIITIIFIILITGCIWNSNHPKHENEIKRSYTKTISRISENAFTDSLIYEAEKIYPERDSVLAVVNHDYIDNVPESGYWFYSSFDCIYLPYAITNEAINYYDGLIDSLRIGNTLQFIITANFE